jgi:cysteine-rich repeat protein
MDMTRSLLLAAFAVVLPACAIESPVFGEPDLDVGAAETSSTTTAGAGGAGGAPATSTGSGTTASGAASTVSASSVTATASSAASTSSGGVVTCGNGVIDPGEECDDLGVLPGDGCGPTCILEGSPNLCPSGATMKVNGPVVIAGTTVGKQNITKTSCGGTSAPDVVYQVIPSKSGPLTVQLETPTTYDRVLSVRTNCTDTGFNAELTCADNGTTLSHTVNAQQGISFHVVISGHSGSTGTYTLRLTP